MRRPKPQSLFILIFMLLAGMHQLRAQLSTDRPSQSFGTTVIQAGRLQFETGFQVDGADGEASTTYNTPVIRYGVNEFFELRFFTNFVEGSGEFTYTPLNFGFKSKLAEENGILPELSFAAHLALPSGNNEFRSESVVPTFRIIANHSLGDNWSLGYNWGMDWTENVSGVTNAWTLIVGTSFSDKMGWFGEVYGFVTENDEDFGADTGLTYLLADRLQLDASGGIGLTAGIPDWFFNAGISFAVGK